MTRVLMICAHEPSLDPRIGWEAAGASDRFEVTVLGFDSVAASRPEREDNNGFRVIRLKPREVSGISYLCRLAATLPRGAAILWLAAVLALSPLILLGELLARLSHTARHRVVPAKAGVGAGRIRSSGFLRYARGLAAARLLLMLLAVRVRFATATAVFWKHLHNAPQKPDVVHCNDLDTLLVGVLAKQQYGCWLVYDAHEFFPQSDPDAGWLEVVLFATLERWLIRKADAVVTVNPLLAETMRAAYRLDHVFSVPNAEPWVGAPAPAAPGSEMERLAAGRTRFLFQGRFSSGRGIEEMIEGWMGVDPARAALFLRGPTNVWRNQVITLAARLGLLDHSVYFLDPVSEDRLVAAAAEADVGIIPYRPLIINDRLSCPNKLSQYLHAGLMVIANDLPYVKSILIEAEAGAFYNSADPATLQKAVSRILDDPGLLYRSRQNALRFARDRFNWQKHGETLYSLYAPNHAAEVTAPTGAFAPAAG